ncbi:hypothetical protein PHYBLDRAFT_68262 [Phycomyces blakesleeanus NRRL 1555(-)]|uniref:Uncharacterized protein n=1 Tax=Phycomyces blakesleeanus (strain ATCC 8743b / DSM 1359 / FGSC 10004 / NBRC 33097 / NRRL 1555) TaxID=763407 RepID=A0A162ZMR9_PHYB8|nr:hypothetical protein PHYBLDRAFT_68262 [Phycomyces blakesleeanus NRRL 1555(-)]OAD67891.1 hypothetical protein PHYBLDRAFT_68262 [Phycomyces blakesleeanus NRRL 1555(-)]|eukprot:XP_018285931.1 hypothetical protein PHYBLDRAFT_68262 [Phycomyces blakesleeanus NRRL 1555(-)]
MATENAIRKRAYQTKDKGKQMEKDVGDQIFFYYNPFNLVIIAFGTGMKGKYATKFKGYCVGGVGVLYRALKSKEMSGDFLVADVDKFRVPKRTIFFEHFKESSVFCETRQIIGCIAKKFSKQKSENSRMVPESHVLYQHKFALNASK